MWRSAWIPPPTPPPQHVCFKWPFYVVIRSAKLDTEGITEMEQWWRISCHNCVDRQRWAKTEIGTIVTFTSTSFQANIAI